MHAGRLWRLPSCMLYKMLESGRTMTMVRDESMVVDWSVQRKSTDTKGSSLTHRMPFMAPSANRPGLNRCAEAGH